MYDSSKRFSFGRNWSRYIKLIDEERIREAERSLLQMLDEESLEGFEEEDKKYAGMASQG